MAKLNKHTRCMKQCGGKGYRKPKFNACVKSCESGSSSGRTRSAKGKGKSKVCYKVVCVSKAGKQRSINCGSVRLRKLSCSNAKRKVNKKRKGYWGPSSKSLFASL